MIRALIAILLVLCASPAAADELRPGYLEFSQKNAQEWRLVWKAPLRAGITPLTQPVLPTGCAITRVIERSRSDIAVMTVSGVTCTGPVTDGRIGVSSMDGSQTDILARVAPIGRPVQAMRLTAAAPIAEIRAVPDRLNVARTYFTTGVSHILGGYDHLLFVVALVLLLGRLRPIAWAVTAFTVAHSITLIGTALGLFGLPQRPVESVIALSILFLAVEIVKADPATPRLSQRVPWVIAFLFGLLHGFGFAGALKEIGLPESDVPTALLSFNLGVEAGQLLIVFATWAILALIRRLAVPYLRPAIVTASYAIGIVASVWFFDRSFC